MVAIILWKITLLETIKMIKKLGPITSSKESQKMIENWSIILKGGLEVLGDERTD
jgi:hypothetical protein